MRIAILADIHGNLPALEAVCADLRRQQPDLVFLGGDQVNRCPWSNEVMDLVADMGWPAIAGNHELVLAALGTPASRPIFEIRQRFPDLWWTWDRLPPHHLAAIRSLSPERTIRLEGAPPIRLVHGLSGNPLQGYTEQMSNEQMAETLLGVEEPVVIGAHTHQPVSRQVGRWTVYNPGSIGMPYNGDPRAQYLLLDLVQGDGRNGENGPYWRPTFRQVAYPVELVRQGYIESGLAEVCGPLASLYIQTIETGLPWVSDFGYWMRSQPESAVDNLEQAVAEYREHHGPGRWAFMAGS